MDDSYYILFALCIFFHIIRTIYSKLKYRKKINPKNKLVFSIMFVVMIGMWVSWFQMCEIDPVKLNIPEYLKYIGLILFIAGLVLFIAPLIQMRGLENIDHLITTGIFSIIRHPMYLGMIFWVVGYPLFLQSKITLISSILWIANILYWRYLEEKEMLDTYPTYSAYKKSTLF